MRGNVADLTGVAPVPRRPLRQEHAALVAASNTMPGSPGRASRAANSGGLRHAVLIVQRRKPIKAVPERFALLLPALRSRSRCATFMAGPVPQSLRTHEE